MQSGGTTTSNMEASAEGDEGKKIIEKNIEFIDISQMEGRMLFRKWYHSWNYYLIN
jgi:hypothetical protein